jgi:hypothetical protein
MDIRFPWCTPCWPTWIQFTASNPTSLTIILILTPPTPMSPSFTVKIIYEFLTPISTACCMFHQVYALLFVALPVLVNLYKLRICTSFLKRKKYACYHRAPFILRLRLNLWYKWNIRSDHFTMLHSWASERVDFSFVKLTVEYGRMRDILRW